MSFVRQSPSKCGKEAIEYIRDGKYAEMFDKKNKDDEIIPYEDQMKEHWRHDVNPRHKNEVRRIIISFAPDEIDCRRYPNGDFVDPTAPYKALEITKAFISETFPDREVMIAVQADGKRSKNYTSDGRVHPSLHTHCAINDWAISDGKGVPTKQTDAKWLAHAFSEFAKNYTFEDGTKFQVTKDQDKNMKSLDANYKKKGKKSWFEDQHSKNNYEKINEEGFYTSYNDYFVDVINSAKANVSSFDEFEKYLSDRGVEIEHKSSKSKGEYLKYSLRQEYIYKKDADNSKAIVKAGRTYNPSIGDAKLSKWADDDMGYSGIRKAITSNLEKASSKKAAEKSKKAVNDIFSADALDMYSAKLQSESLLAESDQIDMKEFMIQNYDFFYIDNKDLSDSERTEFVKAAYIEFLQTGKMPEREEPVPIEDSNDIEEQIEMANTVDVLEEPVVEEIISEDIPVSEPVKTHREPVKRNTVPVEVQKTERELHRNRIIKETIAKGNAIPDVQDEVEKECIDYV